MRESSTIVNAPTTSRRAAEAVAALLLLCLGTSWYLAPAFRDLAGSLGPDLGDPLLNLYFTQWTAHVLDTGAWARFWSPPFFYPTPGVLTYSDHLFGPGFAVWLLGKAGVGPVAAFNLLVLATFPLLGWTTWWLFRRLGVSWVAALAGGWIVAYGHFRWGEMAHYQVLRAQWIPLVLWSFDRVLAAPRMRTVAGFLLVYALHLSGGTYLAYMVHFPMLALLVVRWRADEIDWRDPAGRRALGAAGAVAVTLLATAFSGYLQSWGEGTAVRGAWEIRQYGATLDSLRTASFEAPEAAVPVLAPVAGRGSLFFGFVPLALAAVGAWTWLRRPLRGTVGAHRSAVGWTLAVLGALAGWLALGWADLYTTTGVSVEWLAAVGLPRYNGPRVILALGAAAVAIGLWIARAGRERAPSRLTTFERGLLAGGALSLALSLPLGFTTLTRFVPGMQGMRVAHRFYLFAALAGALLAARGLDDLRRRAAGRFVAAAVVAMLLAGLAIELRPRKFNWLPVAGHPREFPAYAHWIADAPEVRAYVELPLYENFREALRMHYQTLHWKPMVNGYSANIPRSYYAARDLLAHPPSAEARERLRQFGVTHLVVHWVERGRRGRLQVRAGDTPPDWITDGVREGWLEPRFDDGTSAVFRLATTAVRDPRPSVNR